MSYPVYSTTFIRASSKDVWVYYTVPAGYRAVVKNITTVGGVTAGGICWITCGGITIMYRPHPGPNSWFSGDLMVVAYAGEQVGAINYGQAASTCVSGFLLHSPAGSNDSYGPVTHELLREPGQLPE